MTVFDYLVMVLIALSIGLGCWRGFAYEFISLAGWIAAYFVARFFAADVTEYVPNIVSSITAKTTVAYASLFMATLLVSSIFAWLLSKIVKFAGIGLMDGVVGGVFGLIRGVLLVLILVLLAGLTTLPKKPFWREAWSSKSLQNVALLTKDLLPENVAKKVAY
jgi:membrane protein required for colicin V production